MGEVLKQFSTLAKEYQTSMSPEGDILYLLSLDGSDGNLSIQSRNLSLLTMSAASFSAVFMIRRSSSVPFGA